MKVLKIIAACIIAAALGYFVFAEIFVLETVEIYGGNEGEILRASCLESGSSIFRIKEDAVRAGVDALGTYALEDMKILYPNRVRIVVRERIPAAMLLHEERIAVLDVDAVLIELVDEVPERDLIYISGMKIKDAVPGRAIESQACAELLSVLKACEGEHYISEMDLSDEKNLRIISRLGNLVLLGDSENLEEKSAWMKSALQDLELRGESGGILDVSCGKRAYYIPWEN